MFQKIFNTILALIFVVLVTLYAYKTLTTPQILKSTLSENNIMTNNSSLSKEELNAAIKEYIVNNPEDIIASLEKMQQKKAQESAEQAFDFLEKNREAIENVDSPPIVGNPKGDISIVVFYDYNCSFCKKANENTNEIIAIDPGVKVILRPIPILGGSSIYASKAALAIQKISQEKFPIIHNEMMRMKTVNEDAIKSLVKKYEIDYAVVENEVNSFHINKLINKNFELAKGLGIQGAPSYVINGYFVPGLTTVDKFKTIITQIRKSLNSESDNNLKKEETSK